MGNRERQAARRQARRAPIRSCPCGSPTGPQQFDRLLETYQDTVLASFAGHTHTDDFRLVNTAGVNQGIRVDRSADLANLRSESRLPDRDLSRRRFTRRSVDLLPDKPEAGEQQGPRTLEKGVHVYPGMENAATGSCQPWERSTARSRQPGAARDRWLKLYNVSSPAAQVSRRQRPWPLLCNRGARPGGVRKMLLPGNEQRPVVISEPRERLMYRLPQVLEDRRELCISKIRQASTGNQVASN